MVIHRLKDSKKILLALNDFHTIKNKSKLLSTFKQIIGVTSKETKNKEVKSRLEKIHNIADSLIGGLSTQDYNLRQVAEFRLKALERISSMIEKEEEYPSDKPREKTQAEKDEELLQDDDLDEVTERESNKTERNLETLLKNTPHLIKKYSKSSKLLTEVVSKKFILAKVPVIPMTTPIMSFDALKKMHFPVDKIGQYTVLENQLVLGLNASWIKKVRAETKRSAAQIAEHLTKQMSKTSGKKFVILGPGYPYKLGMFFWIAPEHQINLMLRATETLRKDRKGIETVPMNKRLIISKWGFAF